MRQTDVVSFLEDFGGIFIELWLEMRFYGITLHENSLQVLHKNKNKSSKLRRSTGNNTMFLELPPSAFEECASWKEQGQNKFNLIFCYLHFDELAPNGERVGNSSQQEETEKGRVADE